MIAASLISYWLLFYILSCAASFALGFYLGAWSRNHE